MRWAAILLMISACAPTPPSNAVPTVDATAASAPSASGPPSASATAATSLPLGAFERIRDGNGAGSSLAARDGGVFLFDMILDESPAEGSDVDIARFDPEKRTTTAFGRFHVQEPLFLWEEPIRVDASGVYLRDAGGLHLFRFAGGDRVYPVPNLTDAVVEGPVAWLRTVDAGPRATDGRLHLSKLTLASGAIEEVASAAPGSRAMFPNLFVSSDVMLTVTGPPRTLLLFSRKTLGAKGAAPKVIALPPSHTAPRPEVDASGELDMDAGIDVAFAGDAILVLLTVKGGTRVLRLDPPYDATTIVREDPRPSVGTLAHDDAYLYYAVAKPSEGTTVLRTEIATGKTDAFEHTFYGAMVAVDGPWIYVREGATGSLFRSRLK